MSVTGDEEGVAKGGADMINTLLSFLEKKDNCERDHNGKKLITL